MFHYLKNLTYYLLFFCLLSFGADLSWAESRSASVKSFSLEMQNINLSDAIRIMAKWTKRNLIISPAIRGVVSLSLHDASAQEAFDLLLASQGLTKLAMGNVWYIAHRSELAKHKIEEQKLQEAMNMATPLMMRIWQIRYAKADDLARLLQDHQDSMLSKRGTVRVDARTNTLCVQDLPDNLLKIHALIKKLDIPVQQVLIEARLASIDSDYERELGVNFSVSGVESEHEAGMPHVVSNGTRFNLAVAKLANGSFLDVALAALEKEGKGELISSPSLFTANQQTATIESGEEIPYQEISRSGATGVAFKKAVLSLKVTPQIMPGNKVLLQLSVNQDKPSNREVLGVPAISTRQITTNILIKNGQTLVLGGIYELNREHDEQRLPFLGKIPLVGVLFREQNTIENKRELLVFVTPKIISESR